METYQSCTGITYHQWFRMLGRWETYEYLASDLTIHSLLLQYLKSSVYIYLYNLCDIGLFHLSKYLYLNDNDNSITEPSYASIWCNKSILRFMDWYYTFGFLLISVPWKTIPFTIINKISLMVIEILLYPLIFQSKSTWIMRFRWICSLCLTQLIYYSLSDILVPYNRIPERLFNWYIMDLIRWDNTLNASDHLYYIIKGLGIPGLMDHRVTDTSGINLTDRSKLILYMIMINYHELIGSRKLTRFLICPEQSRCIEKSTPPNDLKYLPVPAHIDSMITQDDRDLFDLDFGENRLPCVIHSERFSEPIPKMNTHMAWILERFRLWNDDEDQYQEMSRFVFLLWAQSCRTIMRNCLLDFQRNTKTAPLLDKYEYNTWLYPSDSLPSVINKNLDDKIHSVMNSWYANLSMRNNPLEVLKDKKEEFESRVENENWDTTDVNDRNKLANLDRLYSATDSLGRISVFEERTSDISVGKELVELHLSYLNDDSMGNDSIMGYAFNSEILIDSAQ